MATAKKGIPSKRSVKTLPKFTNPFKPGAGHMPPYLAGRKEEQVEFKRLLEQDAILENLILTGLRGVGKTVLLETFKPLAISEGWLWVGTDLSESVSVSDENLAIRLLSDLASVTSGIRMTTADRHKAGFVTSQKEITWGYPTLRKVYDETPGLVADKLKRVLEDVSTILTQVGKRGIIFAYDEAQNLSDSDNKDQYPLSILLDVFQSIQRKGVRFLLALTGLPTLFPKLVEARTYSERLFRVIFLKRLSEGDARDAIVKPIADERCPVTFQEVTIERILINSGGYPYFIQFYCKEIFDRWVQQIAVGEDPNVIFGDITRKLDTDFFAGRWAKVTDRQRDLLGVVARMPNSDGEFTVREIVAMSQILLANPFSDSRVFAILKTMMEAGLVYKNRHGKYRFAVPMFGQFILRHLDGSEL
jgi:hypothetical protein